MSDPPTRLDPEHLPTVTVVVAAYNHERWVREALESVREQSYPNIELIITDDCSQDGTATQIENWLSATGYPARTLLHERNRGVCATFNEALAMVDTPLYTIMSADDRMFPDRLARQVPILLQRGEGCAAVYADAALIDEQGRDLRRLYSSVTARGSLPEDEDVFAELLLKGNWLPAPTVLLRTDVVHRVGGYNEGHTYEDYDLWLRLARESSLAVVHEPLVWYRRHGSSLGTVMFEDGRMKTETLYIQLGHSTPSSPLASRLLAEARAHLRHRYGSGAPAPELAPLATLVARRSPSPANLAMAFVNHVGISRPRWIRRPRRSST